MATATLVEAIEELRAADYNYALEIALANLEPHLRDLTKDSQKQELADLIQKKLEAFPMLKKSARTAALGIINQLTAQLQVVSNKKIDWSVPSVVHEDGVSKKSSEEPPRSSRSSRPPNRPA